MINVFASEPWYRSRPEPEHMRHGALVKTRIVAGPKARTALTHALRTDREEIAVYGAGVGEVLAPFVGKRVTIVAKLVDLSSEGFDKELWIGRIEIAT